MGQPCRRWARGQCDRGDTCRHLHVEPAPAAAEQPAKRKAKRGRDDSCHQRASKGRRTYGNKCRFVHHGSPGRVPALTVPDITELEQGEDVAAAEAAGASSSTQPPGVFSAFPPVPPLPVQPADAAGQPTQRLVPEASPLGGPEARRNLEVVQQLISASTTVQQVEAVED